MVIINESPAVGGRQIAGQCCGKYCVFYFLENNDAASCCKKSTGSDLVRYRF